MLSCASPAGMPPGPHAHSPNWSSLLQPPTIKSEPMEEGGFAKDQTSGFYSEGFHSASPSSSSKDSNGHSPRSVGSAGEAMPFYENMALKAKANLGMHLGSYQNGMPYNLLTPPGFEARHNEDRGHSPGYETSYSPRTLAPPVHVSTPISRADATPPKSPPGSPDRDHETRSYERFHDSGFDGNQNKPEGDDGRDGSGLDDDFDEEPGLRVPAVNSHGKVKTFKCKQCEFVAVTKLSFWEHSKEHIKPEKMLSCRKLLNSHLKSHSNVYQYRCADCNYATKYCHSLKLHLRKYQHNPAMVLNLDGTPNPLPIIDVYGTRRGPKQKPLSKMFEHSGMSNNNNSQHTQPPSHPLFGGHFPVNLSPYLPPLLPHSFLFPPNNNYERSESDASADVPTSSASSTYSCQYCDITFGDLTMHTIHMGFHGYNDPFMCNKCGERSADRVAFFIHLGRAQHA
ncbi:PREDICTED: protein hunchback [Papilio polytes]|uniref:protein hunchback n=1 Tax=Papilio polytes TaxID=76194 RepID=UPI0006766ED0|nr:PREDICTED: protein hunchback [Papilio polytes]